MHRPNSATLALLAAAAACLTGCGSTAAAPAPTPTVTAVGSGAQPVSASGSATGASKPEAPPLATGKHDHPGDLCSGREDARYAGERMTCIVGRLQRLPAHRRGGRAGRRSTR